MSDVILRREVISDEWDEIEKDAGVGVIVDTGYLKEAVRMIRPAHFHHWTMRRIFEFCAGYLKKYKEAPGDEIFKEFKDKWEEKLTEQETFYLEKLLTGMSEYYEGGAWNQQRLLDRTRDWVRSRNLDMLKDRISKEQKNTREGLDKAEAEIRNFQKVSATTRKATTLDDAMIDKVWQFPDPRELWKVKGRLGDLIGKPLKRGWLVGIEAPVKRGKSWFGMHFGMEAIREKLKVLVINLEMDEEDYYKRQGYYLTNTSEYGEEVQIPYIDCTSNQDGSCDLPERINDITLKKDSDGFPAYSPRQPKNYKPCSVCEEKKLPSFRPAVFQTKEQSVKFTTENLREVLKKTKMLIPLHSHFRMLTYTIGRNTMERIIEDIEDEESRGFLPDIIIFDYIDLVKRKISADASANRDFIMQVWEDAAGIARDKPCLVMVITQTNRGSTQKKVIDEMDTGYDFRKLANVDLMLGITADEDQRDRGILMVNVVEFRHGRHNKRRQIMMLQNLECGQVCLDAEWDDPSWRARYGREEREKPPFSEKEKRRKDIHG